MAKIERQLQGDFAKFFSQRIEEKKIKGISPTVVQEEERADISIKNSEGGLLFFIELKDPTTAEGKTVYNQTTIARETQRAQRLKVANFGICNFKNAAVYGQTRKGGLKMDFIQGGGMFTDEEIKNLQANYTVHADKPEFKKKMLVLIDFYLDICQQILTSKTFVGKNLDEMFIFIIKELMNTCADPITAQLEEIYNTPHSPLINKINDYCSRQFWDVPKDYQQFKNLVFISLLVLISKLIFYKCYYDAKTWSALAPLTIPANINAATLELCLFNFFDDFKSVTGNFETLIGENTDAIFQIPFISDEVVPLVQEIVNYSNHYDFSKIEADVIGRIFEELISPQERHKLGQYFTPPAVIDLMLSFCLTNKNYDAKVFDPSCGSGTFLVRAYARKQHLNKQQHTALLRQIWGNDLSNYPAYLAMFNLAMRQHNRPSYPRIFNKDFFAIIDGKDLELHTENGNEELNLPQFDIIVGNPPYTRQEDIGTMQGTQKKEQIIKLLSNDNYPQIKQISQRSSLYAYFFYRSANYLKEDGFMAFVVANSWLESEFGADLQRFFCQHFHIIAIIDSESERFFPSASVNTTIVILQKNGTPNPAHQVRFIYLKQNLDTLLKKASRSPNPYIQSDALHHQLVGYNQSTENSDLKIRLVAQSYLSQTQKWGQFLKAPQVFFDIFYTHKAAFQPLSTFATVKFGIKTGNNEFFIGKNENLNYEKQAKPTQLPFLINNLRNLDDFQSIKKKGLVMFRTQANETWLIEKELLRPVFGSPKNSKTYVLDLTTIDEVIFSADLEKEELKKRFPHAYEYVKQGEAAKIHEKSTLASRNIWYNLNIGNIPQLNFNKLIHDVGRTFLGEIYTKDTFFSICVKEKEKANSLLLYLNSTFIWLWQQITMRANFGDGVGEIQTYEFADFPVLDIDLSELGIDLGKTASYKDELGAAQKLADINPQRLKLDRAIIAALGVAEDQQEQLLLDMYQATKKLIDKRLEKPASVVEENEKRKKTKETASLAHLFTQINAEVEAQSIDLEQPDKGKVISALEKIIAKLSSNAKQREKIMREFWLSHYKEVYDKHTILNAGNQTLF